MGSKFFAETGREKRVIHESRGITDKICTILLIRLIYSVINGVIFIIQ